MTEPNKYTVVQHSGFGYGSDPQFQHGLESRSVLTKAERERVTKAGGLLFDTYTEAEDFAADAMYGTFKDDPGNTRTFDLTPRAKGTFSDKKVDGLRIYIPVREVTG